MNATQIQDRLDWEENRHRGWLSLADLALTACALFALAVATCVVGLAWLAERALSALLWPARAWRRAGGSGRGPRRWARPRVR